MPEKVLTLHNTKEADIANTVRDLLVQAGTIPKEVAGIAQSKWEGGRRTHEVMEYVHPHVPGGDYEHASVELLTGNRYNVQLFMGESQADGVYSELETKYAERKGIVQTILSWRPWQ